MRVIEEHKQKLEAAIKSLNAGDGSADIIQDIKKQMNLIRVEAISLDSESEREKLKQWLKAKEQEVAKGKLFNVKHVMSNEVKKGIESLKTLQVAKETMQETEEVAASTALNLSVQNEKIKRTHKKVRQVDRNLSSSENLLDKLSSWWTR